MHELPVDDVVGHFAVYNFNLAQLRSCFHRRQIDNHFPKTGTIIIDPKLEAECGTSGHVKDGSSEDEIVSLFRTMG